jgi:polyferredoxin
MNILKEKNIYRKALQVTILLLLGYMVARIWIDPNYIADFEAYCPFGGMQAFTSFLVTNTLACSMTEAQIFMGIVLIAGVILFSKLFCSYVCPVGTFSEWFGKLGQKIKMHITLKGAADKSLRLLKYALLFVTFYFTVGSSELFCKEYDPFYAAFTGFGHDVVLYLAIPALLVTVIGSIFIRQFWCKYFCPLGAATNIFANGIMFGGVILIYVLLRISGLEISWLWLLGIIVGLGFILEVTRMKGWILPPVKITRDELGCTNCGLCDESCPMGIEVSKEDPVTHIDCHLCGDCLYACPEKNVLQIRKKEMRWLPATATIALILIGLFLARTIELPTINMRWGDEQKQQTASVFSLSGLKSVKCYGSSMSFASAMKRVRGVLGVETYVKTHTVKVFYDPEVLNDVKIKEAIFSPSKTMLKTPPEGSHISAMDIGIDKLFDSYDSFYLTQLLHQTDGIIGFETHYGEPVSATIFFIDSLIDPQKIKSVIESPSVTYSSRGKEYTQNLRFQVASVSDSIKILDKNAYTRIMFQPFELNFNDYNKYAKDDLAIYKIHMPQAMNPGLRRSLNMLVSHISTDDYVVRFETVYLDKPYANIYYVKDKTNHESIYNALMQDKLTVHYSNGKVGEVANPFKFPAPGKIYSVNQ